MFYRKTDIEVLCETLVKLVDKHDKALKTLGKEAAAPHALAMEAVTKNLDEVIQLDINPIYVLKPDGKAVKASKPVDDKTPTRRFIGTSTLKKRGRPATKPKLTMVSGGSDDIRPDMHQVKEQDYTEQNKIVDEFNKKQEEEHPTDQTIADLKKSEEDVKAGRVTTYKTGQEALRALEKEEKLEAKPTQNSSNLPKPTQPGVVTPDNIDNMADQLAR